jgi:hypothetical protein
MTRERPLFQKHDGNLAVEVREIEGKRSIELLKRYEKNARFPRI